MRVKQISIASYFDLKNQSQSDRNLRIYRFVDLSNFSLGFTIKQDTDINELNIGL